MSAPEVMTARKRRRLNGGNRISRKQDRKARRWDHNKPKKEKVM